MGIGSDTLLDAFTSLLDQSIGRGINGSISIPTKRLKQASGSVNESHATLRTRAVRIVAGSCSNSGSAMHVLAKGVHAFMYVCTPVKDDDSEGRLEKF